METAPGLAALGLTRSGLLISLTDPAGFQRFLSATGHHEQVNPVLARMYQDDQRDREIFARTPAATWEDEEHQAARRAMGENDLQRRGQLRQMLDQVTEPEDCYHAAMIFQHGEEPEDYLQAHKLARQAALGGYEPARQLAAQSLDRYLQSSGEAQVIGTQFFVARPCSMEPFDRTLPDAVRQAFGVRTLAQSSRLMEEVDAGRPWDQAVDKAAKVPQPPCSKNLLQQARAANPLHGYVMSLAAALLDEPGAVAAEQRAFERFMAAQNPDCNTPAT